MFNANQHIAMEGDTKDHVVGIVSGMMRCFRINPDGRRFIYDFSGPGSLIGLQFGDRHICSTEAVTDCEVVMFRTADIDAAFEQVPEARCAILRTMTEEVAQRQWASFRLAHMSADQRVADYILELADEGRVWSIHLAMSRMDLADHLGLTFETVSRSFRKLDELGLIRLHTARRFDIQSHEGLQHFVGVSHVGAPTRLRVPEAASLSEGEDCCGSEGGDDGLAIGRWVSPVL